ncbi:MAG: DUF1501 domain-containing protein [Planctomycetaceae bacterium]
MKELVSQLDGVGRRTFLEYAAKTLLGVSVLPALSRTASAQTEAAGKAKRMIYLFMNGGMTHLDTFDLKPGHENQGETQPISTSVPGLQISQFLPTLASQFDKIAAIRSMYTQTGDHQGGEYLMRTSYDEIATERHPSLGPWIQQFKGRQSKSLPDTVLVGAPARHPGAGFFDPTFSPLPIGDPNRGLENTTAPEYLTQNSFAKRVKLIDGFDKKFRSKYNVRKVQSYTDFYTEATTLLSSGELKSFDLNEEKAEDRDRYGRDAFGQGCLLARRLIENNVRCVEVSCGGWDMHNSIFDGGSLPARAGILDRAMGNLIKDLAERGLLNETLIVLTTEFGRSPVINYNAGRDHHPAVFSAALAGGGIKGGQLYGTSDAAGHAVDKDGVPPADFNATIATSLGLPLDKVVHSPTGRPFKVAHDGKPIAALL